MRLFIAVELEKDIIAAFCSLHDELKRRADKMRFVPLQNLHLTLFFLAIRPKTSLLKSARLCKA